MLRRLWCLLRYGGHDFTGAYNSAIRCRRCWCTWPVDW
jgi:hypothetical protein